MLLSTIINRAILNPSLFVLSDMARFLREV